MKPALEFWPALWTALLATLFAAQLVVGLAHAGIERRCAGAELRSTRLARAHINMVKV